MLAADTLIQTSNGAPFLRTASVERAAADAAAKKQAAEAKIASLGVTAPERTASAEIKQLASRQAMLSTAYDAVFGSCHRTASGSSYAGPGFKLALKRDNQGRVGIDFMLQDRDGPFVIMGLAPGAPAARSGGIQLGDFLHAVDYKPLAGKHTEQVRRAFEWTGGTDDQGRAQHRGYSDDRGSSGEDRWHDQLCLKAP